MKRLFRLIAVLAIVCVPLVPEVSLAQAPATPAPAAADAPAAAPAGTGTRPVISILDASAPAAPAETAAAVPARKPGSSLDPVKLFREGGITIYALLALSLVMCALIVFYFLTIRRAAVVSDAFMRTAEGLIRKQDYAGLLTVCNRRSEAIALITQKALDFATKNPTATLEEVRQVTESEGQRQASQLSQRIAYLADIAAIAPMVGLLGTVFGIMKEFGNISDRAAQLNMMKAQMSFAGGTAEALVNTAAGLVIAIPSMIVYSIYKGKVNQLISELEAASTYIMALLSAQYKRVTAQARAQQMAAREQTPTRTR
jgi:biopolymer transport protein ExbB